MKFDIGGINITQDGVNIFHFGVLVDDIIIAVIVSLLAAPLWLAIKTHKIINKGLRFLNVTQRYGDEDVWDFVLSSPDTQAKYVNVRDHERNLTYSGFVGVYSERVGIREIVLTDVIVYSSDTADEIY